MKKVTNKIMNKKKYYPDSKVEIHNFAANYYDTILNIVSLGTYPFFIRNVIAHMKILPQDRILDLGAGSGRNALLMRPYLSEEGEIINLDISTEMITQFKKKISNFNNIKNPGETHRRTAEI